MAERAPSPAPRVRATRIVSWGLGLGLAGLAIVGPALAEARIQSSLREQFAVAVDFDLAGLELRGLARDLPDGRGWVRAEHVRVRPSFAGLRVEIEGLDANLHRARPKQRERSASPGRTRARDPEPTREPEPDPLAHMLERLRGVPIEVVTRGEVELELGTGLRATARDPKLTLVGDGRISGHAALELGASGDTPWASATLEFATTDAAPRDLRVDGSVTLSADDGEDDGRERVPLTIHGRATPRALAIELREPAGGVATVEIERGDADGRDRARLDAVELPVELIEPLAQLFGRRIGDALGEHEGRVDLDDTRLTGVVEVVRGGGLTRARFEDVELSSLRIDSRLVAAEPVELGRLSVDGELAREHGPDGARSFGTLMLGHRDVQVELSGQLDPRGLSFDLQIPSTPCQALLDASPGISPVLAGTELGGSIDVHLGLDLDFAALERARARYLGDDAEPLELEHFEAPGELRFSLPYLEGCTVERLGPGVDLDGLDGPYHHRFSTGQGEIEQLVLAIGDERFTPIQRVPRLALAFVILEDSRYWQHDGFDREQLERAFWFNLLEGRVSRGASTITQQTARSLWLGIDRSLTRKLGEAILAAELERHLDKRRILEVYLNVIELGPGVHGITEAARYHFDKTPNQLSLIEALHLASLAPAPVAYSRRFADGHVDREWRAHLRRQVRRLRIRHLISPAQAETAMRVNLQLRSHPELAPATHRRG